MGGEPICRALQVAPATYYAARCRQPRLRHLFDEKLKPEIVRIHKENLEVYETDKV